MRYFLEHNEFRTSDAAADVDDLHAGFQTQHRGELLGRVEAAGADERVAEDALIAEDPVPGVLAVVQKLSGAVLLFDRHFVPVFFGFV